MREPIASSQSNICPIVRSELMIEALGHQGLGWDGPGYETPEIVAVRGWLRTKANSIEGGTSEVNLNVIAKRVLGLPDMK